MWRDVRAAHPDAASPAAAFIRRCNLTVFQRHRCGIMNFEPGNQEGEERVVSLILFASDSACRCKSEGEKASARTRARVIALIGCQYRQKGISKLKALDVYNRGIPRE